MEMKMMMNFVVNADYIDDDNDDNNDDDNESNDSFILIYFGRATKPEFGPKHFINILRWMGCMLMVMIRFKQSMTKLATF